MKKSEKKKEKNLEEIFDEYSKKGVKLIQKISKKENEPFLSILVRIVLLFVYLLIVHFLFVGIEMIGTVLIYKIASTFREILSNVWHIVLTYSFFAFMLHTLVTEWKRLKSKVEYKALYKDDLKEKKKINAGMTQLFKVLNFLLLIPLLVVIFLSFVGLGILIYLHTQGMYLYGLYLLLISIIVITGSVFQLIHKKFREKEEK